MIKMRNGYDFSRVRGTLYSRERFFPVVFFLILFLSFCSPYKSGEEPDGSDDWELGLQYLSTISLPAWAWGSEAKIFVDVDSDRLYIPLGYPGLAVYDIGDPASPQEILRMHSLEFPMAAQPGATTADGSRVFVSLPTHECIAVMDISAPAAPVFRGVFGNIEQILQVALRGSFLYVYADSSFAYDGGVYVFDVSTDTPEQVGQYLTPLIDPGFYVSPSGVVFFARTPAHSSDRSKVEVVDMGNPAEPLFISQWASSYPGNITDIYLVEDQLFCSAYWGGLWILDASDFSNLQLAIRFDWEESAPYALSVQAIPPYVFMAQAGPGEMFWKFAVFRQNENRVSIDREITADSRPHSVYLVLEKDLLILVEQDPVGFTIGSHGGNWLPSSDDLPQKILYFYKIQKTYQ